MNIADHIEELAALGGDETKIRAWLHEKGLELYPSKTPAQCPAMQVGDLRCVDGWHERAGKGGGTRAGAIVRCGLARYREARVLYSDRLARCGYGKGIDETRADITAQLLAGIDSRREVSGLVSMLHVARAACAAPLAANTALTGSCGTAKTVVLFAIYFAALKQGFDAAFVTQAELREIAQDLDSFDPIVKARAQARRTALAKRQLLVIDDLADRKNSNQPTEGVLLDILIGPAAAWSSNLKEKELAQHQDVGARVVSRLYADRAGVPFRGAHLSGPDQRQHGVREQLRVMYGGRR